MKKETDKEIGRFEDVDFDSFECSSSFARHFVWKIKRKTTILALLISFVLFFLSLPFLETASFLILILLLTYFIIIYSKAETYFMKHFASENNLDYEISIPINSVVGNLFQYSSSGGIRHVLTGSYEKHKTRFFHYQYSIGSGRYRKTFKYTVLEIFFEKTKFPHIFLCSTKRSKRHGKREKGEIEISLENEFKDTFRLFVKRGYAIEAMQIFTPDFLKVLKKEKFDISIEFKEDRIYIYIDFIIKKKKDMIEFYEISHRLLNNVGPLLNRLENDFRALHPYFKRK